VASGQSAPAGSAVGFYQTLPLSGEVPYLIAVQPLDPLSGSFDNAAALASGGLAYATYSANGMTLTSANPAEGASTYKVSASAPLYGFGALSVTVGAPASGTAAFNLAPLALPSGSSASSVGGTLTVTTPGKYDKGMLVLTHDGAVVAAASLDSDLASAQSAATWLSSVPGGTASTTYSPGVYYAEVWVWNSSNPSGTFSRQPYSSAIDLRSGSSSGIALTVD
jgi:hypothetical protein